MYGSHRPSWLSSLLDWSVGVGRLFGIPIRLHVTLLFFLLPVLTGRRLGVAYSLEYAVAVVLCILLHELGHALTAKRYGMTQLSIMLHGFGGFAVSSGYRTPKQALVITLAGPAVTFALGILGLTVGTLGQSAATYGTEASVQFSIVRSLGALNILLGFLNLLPCLPFDGGNALKAILSRKQHESKAARAVAHLGLAFTPPLAIYGLVTDANLIVIFCLIGFLTSLSTLLNSGGIRFGEVVADRRARKDMEAVRKREEAKSKAYLSDVDARLKKREEQERLRRILESPSDLDEP